MEPALALPSFDANPFLLMRKGAQAAEFATWRLSTGQLAVALFLDAATAEAYRTTAGLSADWCAEQLAPEALVRLFEHAVARDCAHAALNPGASAALRLFPLADVVASAKGGDAPPGLIAEPSG